MAMDRVKGRLFIGCRETKNLITLSAGTGKVLSATSIGVGIEATEFDGDIFCGARDGTLTVIRETSPEHFERIQTLATKPWAGALGLDSTTHTLYLGNDNDFLATDPETGFDNPNQWFVFGVTDAQLGTTYVPQDFAAAVPEPQTYALLIAGLAMIGFTANRRRR